MKIKSVYRTALVALIGLPTLPHVHAADGTWTADADGNWSDTANWAGGIVGDGADSTATLDGITANRTVTLDSDRTIGNIIAADTSHNFTISGANTLTLDTTAGTPTIDVANGRILRIDSVMAGNDGISKTGGGFLEPYAANTFTGGVELQAGTLRITNNDAIEGSYLGDSSNTLTFTGDADFNNRNGQVTLPQGIFINPGVTGKVSGAFGERTQVDGVLAGSGTLLVQGNSAGYDAEFRNTANTFTGPIEVQSGDSVTAGFASLPDSPGPTTIGLDSQGGNGAKFEYMNLAIAPLVLDNRQFELIVNGNANTNLGRQPGIVNNAPGANTITVNTDLLITGTGSKKFFLSGGNTGDNTFAGAIPDAIDAGILTVYKDGGGKWILAGANSYEGDTIIRNGTLEIAGGGTYVGNISNQDSTPNPLTFSGSADTTVNGVVSGNIDLIKDGAGVLSLTNANTYTGDTTVAGGTLSLGDGTNSSNLDDFATLSVDTGAVLDLNYVGSDSVIVLNLGGSPAAAGTWGASGSGATNIDDTFFTGTGVINNLGGDTTTLGVAFWDGGDVDNTANGDISSDGGSGTWDDTILNWDFGTVPHGAWPNTTSTTAIFGGSTGTVTLDADMNIGTMTIEVPNGGGSGYNIGDAAEDNTLTFGGDATINVTATGNGSRNDHRIRAGIAGSPTLNVAGRNNNSAFFALEPTASTTMTLGTLNMFNTLASNKQLRLGGSSTGNVVDKITWTVTGNQLQVRKQSPVSGATATDWTVNQDISLDDGRIFVDEGTLIFSGTDNFCSHSIQVEDGGRIVLQGNWRINDEREDFRVLSGGIVAPGASVGTVTFNWNNVGNSTGQVDLRGGSTYEWEVGAASTDTIAVTKVGSESSELVVGDGVTPVTIGVVDAGGSPSAGDKLTVFTCESGVVYPDVTTLTNNTTIDLTGTTWTGTPSWGIDVDGGTGDATIYITGISSGGMVDPFDTWASDNLLDGSPGKENGKGDDPDQGGKTNLYEFGFNGDPLDPANEGLLFGFLGDSDVDGDTDDELLFTIAVRTGTVFSNVGNLAVSAPVDGIIYTVRGDVDLDPLDGDTLVNVATTAVVPAGAPDLSGNPDYEYVTLSLDGSVGTLSPGFMRAEVAEAP
ncbi:MAG: hypothetical protein HKN82_01835 [Akkermansiaceae bacterium]|nr:hypothetical protein [Akkermansiaceae bacterium]